MTKYGDSATCHTRRKTSNLLSNIIMSSFGDVDEREAAICRYWPIFECENIYKPLCCYFKDPFLNDWFLGEGACNKFGNSIMTSWENVHWPA